MKKVMNLLSVMAFALALVAAFAFKGFDPDPELRLFANTPEGWQDITGQPHICDEGATVCVAQFVDDDPNGIMVYSENGIYLP